MSYKVFNQGPKLGPGRTFLLVDPINPKNKMRIPPKATADVPDNFVGDITFRKAVEAGELVIWQEAKEVDKMLKAAEASGHEAEAEKPAKAGRGAGGKNGKKAKEEAAASEEEPEASGEETAEASGSEAEE